MKEIVITKKESDSNITLEYEKLNHYLKSFSNTTQWFNSIIIENIHIDNITASFKYKNGENGFIIVDSKTFHLNANISFHNEVLIFNIRKLQELQKDISAKGNIYLDTSNITLYADMTADIANEANIALYLKSDIKKLSYSLVSNKKIKHIKNLINLANLPKGVLFWAYEAIDMKDVELLYASGYLEYDKIKEAYKNIKIKAIVNKLHYTYNPKLDNIDAKTTELEFLNGILYIRPMNAYTYGMYLNKSNIKIDFTQKEELLTLKLIFDGIVNKDILHILDVYKIKLPFLQNSGSVSTDLTLKIGLRNIDVKAKGVFYIKKANFDYIGLNIDIYDADIKLNNYDVSIKNMKAKYGDIAKANVDVAYNASKKQGKVNFRLTDVNLKGVTFNSTNKPQLASYTISPKGDFITLNKSKWKFKGQIIKIDTTTLPFNLDELKIIIPATFLELQGMGSAFTSGEIYLKDMSAKLNLDILKFSYDGVKLTQSNTPLKIQLNDKLIINSKEDIFLSLSGTKYKVNNFYIEIEEESIKLKHTYIEIGKYISAKLYAQYNTQTKVSHVSLSKFKIVNPSTQKNIYKNKKILLSLKIDKETISAHSKEIDAYFTSKESGWSLRLNSLGRVAKGSELLKSFHLTEGDFTLFRKKGDKNIHFTSNIIYPYKILLKEGKPTDTYNIKGKIHKEKVYLSVNNNFNLELKDTIDVTMKKSPLNIMELLRLVKDMSKKEGESKTLNILLNAKDSYLYVSPQRKIIYDNIDVQYFNKILTAQLEYADGEAGMKLSDKEFHLYGKNFNDIFMNKLLHLSKFTDGSLDFSLNGKIDDYEGVMYIKKSTIKDYKTLNNILAFVNTVPSLITFKLPGYSKNGLFVDKAYINFHNSSGIYNLSNIYLHSKEMDIVGKGKIDLNKENIDLMLNLKTDLGSDLSKVPVVGYILLDGDTISTTLSVTGNLANPQINSHIATNIVVAPLNIIKRTLLLPYKLIQDALADSNTSEK